MSEQQATAPEIKKAWKVYGKDDDEYTKHYADTFHATKCSEAKMQWAARNGEDYINAIAHRAPSEDLRMFEGEWISESSYRSKIGNRERRAKIEMLADDALFYVQDKRQYVGNSVLWWGDDGNGYTTNIEKAWLLSGAEIKEHQWRETDIIWPQEEVQKGILKHVDMQYLDNKQSI